jgi:limonene-1,2-epoxide hydrolase
MTKLSDRQVVEAFLDALERKDMDRALALMDDDIVYQNVPMKPDRGKEATVRTLKRFMRFADTFEVRMHNIAASDGVVLTERTDILKGPWLDMEFWVCGTFEVRDGKITLWRDYADGSQFLLQALTSPVRRLFKRRG